MPSTPRDARSGDLAPSADRSLARSRVLTGASMRIERLWPLAAPFVAVVALFAALAWFGLFRAMPDWARIALVAALTLLAIAALLPLRRYSEPSATAVDRRVERANALSHAPVSAQTDALPDGADPVAAALWAEHRRRMAERLSRLEGAAPRAGMPARDPWALRALVPLVAVVAFAFSFGSNGGRLADAIAPPATAETVAARVDAWVTPPDYTGEAPIFLTRASAEAETAIDPEPTVRTVPAGSVVTLRIAGGDGSEIVELVDAAGGATPIQPAEPDGPPVPGTTVHETTLLEDATVRLAAEGAQLDFPFSVTPDQAPRIAWVENADGAVHERTDTGALALAYEAQDDYPLAGAAAELRPVGLGERPLYDAPDMPLVLPRPNADTPTAITRRDLTEHPFAGAVVEATLVATDRAEQRARSDTRRFVIPERTFRDPLALAVLEQRRALALDADAQLAVVGTLDLLMLHAETTIDDVPHFLGLATARGRVANAWDDDLLREAVDYMWELARAIEDGAVNSAERRLRDAQDAVAEALENGATDEELAELMAELREAMDEFMAMMAERMADMPQMPTMPPGMQFMDQNDLNRMMDQMEEAARNGQREQAQAMLDELRRMMDQMQAGTPQQGQQQDQQMSEMQQQMQEMGDLLREQQELMDETFRMEQSRPSPFDPLDDAEPEFGGEPEFGERQDGGPQQSQPPQMGQQSQPRQPGQQSQPQDGPQQDGQQQAERPQPGEPMTPEEFAEAMEELRQRQEELQQRLEEMQQAMRDMGLEPGDQFGEAGEAMGDAGEDLGEGQSGPAVDDQGRAIQALREGAQNMMQQMMQAMQGQGQQPGGMMPMPGPGQMGQQPGQQPGQGPNRFGQGFGGTREDRDPLGRPRATTGPQFGEEIEVPDEIDRQRAREILESIRRRLGERLTPRLEREYLERLLEMR